MRVLLGILRETRCRTWLFDGQLVVRCVVNVVCWRTLFQGRGMRQVFQIYFRVRSGVEAPAYDLGSNS